MTPSSNTAHEFPVILVERGLLYLYQTSENESECPKLTERPTGRCLVLSNPTLPRIIPRQSELGTEFQEGRQIVIGNLKKNIFFAARNASPNVEPPRFSGLHRRAAIKLYVMTCVQPLEKI
jgi:hypothetical protein